MATIVFDRRIVDKKFTLYHGDDINIKANVLYGEEVTIPVYSEMSEECKESFHRFDIGKFVKYNVEYDCQTYQPITLSISYSSVYPKSEDKEKQILDFLDIEPSYLEEVVNFMCSKNLEVIILKRNFRFFIAKNNDRLFSLIKGNVLKRSFNTAWIHRFDNPNQPLLQIPNYYKKEFKSYYYGGTDGEIVMNLQFRDIYPNLFFSEPTPLDIIPNLINYDEHYKLTKEQEEHKIKEAKKKEKELKEKNSKFNEEERCCRCGSYHASYIENPYMKEMYGMTVMQWLCNDCYNESLGDI